MGKKVRFANQARLAHCPWLTEWCVSQVHFCSPDPHTAAAGLNHSGRLGTTNFLNGVMGIANAQRLLNYIRIITQFISQPEYEALIPIFGVVNEPMMSATGREQLASL